MPSDQQADIHIYDYWHILRKRKSIAVAAFALAIMAVLLINRYQSPLYVTGVELLVDKNQPQVMGDTRALFRVWDDTYLRTQFKILRSRALAEKTVDALLKDETIDKNKLLRGLVFAGSPAPLCRKTKRYIIPKS